MAMIRSQSALIETALLLLLITVALRILMTADLVARNTTNAHALRAGLSAMLKDLLQVPIWAMAFLGNTVLWRGQRLRVLPGGKLVPIAPK